MFATASRGRSMNVYDPRTRHSVIPVDGAITTSSKTRRRVPSGRGTRDATKPISPLASSPRFITTSEMPRAEHGAQHV